METPVFDASRPIAINLRTPGGLKTVRVRFPSDNEWIGRQRRRKVLVKQLGRGISETTVANGEDVDAALVALIQEKPRDGEDPEIDAFEAMKVVEQLSLAEVDDVVPDGDSFKVTLRVLGGTTVHLLKMPAAKDVFDYRRGFARLLDHRLRGGPLQKARYRHRGICGRRAHHPPSGCREGGDRRDGHRIRGGPGRKFLAGEWPDDPSFRFLVHWALRREELCDPGLCPDAPEEDDYRCDHCPLDRLDAAQCAEKGLLIRRALDLMGALKLEVHIGLDEIRADEFCAMLIIAEERDLLGRERAGPGRR